MKYRIISILFVLMLSVCVIKAQSDNYVIINSLEQLENHLKPLTDFPQNFEDLCKSANNACFELEADFVSDNACFELEADFVSEHLLQIKDEPYIHEDHSPMEYLACANIENNGNRYLIYCASDDINMSYYLTCLSVNTPTPPARILIGMSDTCMEEAYRYEYLKTSNTIKVICYNTFSGKTINEYIYEISPEFPCLSAESKSDTTTDINTILHDIVHVQMPKENLHEAIWNYYSDFQSHKSISIDDFNYLFCQTRNTDIITTKTAEISLIRILEDGDNKFLLYLVSNPERYNYRFAFALASLNGNTYPPILVIYDAYKIIDFKYQDNVMEIIGCFHGIEYPWIERTFFKLDKNFTQVYPRFVY